MVAYGKINTRLSPSAGSAHYIKIGDGRLSMQWSHVIVAAGGSVLQGPGLDPRAGPARSPWAGPGQVSIIVCGPGRVRA